MPGSGKSTAARVYDEMRALILDGRLRAGQSLRASALSEEYGFGLTPLREALNRLSTEHLVISSFNHGFQVAGMSEAELEDIERSRALVEAEMLAEAMASGGEPWEGRVVAAHYQLGKQPVPDHRASEAAIDQWALRHKAFHDALLSGCRSVWLGNMAALIGAQLQRYHRNILRDVIELARNSPELARAVDAQLADVMGLAEHTALMDAALSGDIAAARARMVEHARLSLRAYRSFHRQVEERRAA